MTTAELEAIAARTVRPEGRTVVMVVDVTPGGRLANGLPSGIGVETRYGPAWFDGLRRSAPIALFPRQHEAHVLADLLETGSTLRSAPRSVAASSRAVQQGEAPSRAPTIGSAGGVSGSRTARRPTAAGTNGDVASAAIAGSPGAPLNTHAEPGIEALGVTPESSAAAAGVTVADDDGTPSLSPGPNPTPTRVDQADGDPWRAAHHERDPRLSFGPDDVDVRPRGTVNVEELRGEALRSVIDEAEA